MIDLSREAPLSLTAATKYLPLRRGRRVSPATVWRWIARGYRGVRLEGLRTPGGWFTTREAIARFYRELTRAKRREERRRQLSLPETSAERKRRENREEYRAMRDGI